MADTHAPRLDWRRAALVLVMIGAMAVSIGGQVAAIEAQIGVGLAIVFALVNDAGAILALDASMQAKRGSSIRRWAWVAILVAAGTGAALNVLHASTSPDAPPHPLPTEIAYLIGIEPVLLVLVLSHLVALVLEQHREDREHREVPTASPRRDREVPAAAAPSRSARPQVETARSTASATASTARSTERPTASSAERSTASVPGLVATTGAPDREVTRPARAAPRPPATTPAPRLQLAAPPDGDRPDWLTDALLSAVVTTALDAGAPGKRYGEVRLRRDHGLSSHKAQVILKYIDDHKLLRKAS